MNLKIIFYLPIIFLAEAKKVFVAVSVFNLFNFNFGFGFDAKMSSVICWSCRRAVLLQHCVLCNAVKEILLTALTISPYLFYAVYGDSIVIFLDDKKHNCCAIC